MRPPSIERARSRFAISCRIWDALIIASALLGGCAKLYSEDLQHGQVFDDQLTVINPFLSVGPTIDT